MRDLPPGVEWRPDLCDRDDLCPARAVTAQVHCAVPVDPETREHPGRPHWGLGFPEPEPAKEL